MIASYSHALPSTTALGGVTLSCVIDKYVPHDASDEYKEVRAITGHGVLRINEPRVDFVGQCCGPKRVALAFPTYARVCKSAHFVVDHGFQARIGRIASFAHRAPRSRTLKA